MKWIILILALVLAPMAWAADCAVCSSSSGATCALGRSGQGITVARVLVLDSETVDNDTVNKCSSPVRGNTSDTPSPAWEAVRCWVDASDACTSYTINLRDYPTNTSGNCEGACDAHVLHTFDSTAETSVGFPTEVLGEAFDADVTAIDTCTVSVYCDWYYRQK
jgi:hypothetical protein